MDSFPVPDVLQGFVLLILSVFYLPSYLLTMIVISTIKSDYPQWCDETFDWLFVPIFGILNSAYLILLSHFLIWFYDFLNEDKTVPKNKLSIFQ